VGCQKIGENGFAVGIDPQPGSLYRTFLNLENNGFRGRFSLVNAALSMEIGNFIPFSSPNKENRGSASISARKSRDYKDYFILSTTFDQVMNSLKIERVNLFVLDVEGYENIVIKSLSGILPEMIIFEIHPYFIKNTGLEPEEVFKNLRNKGYKIANLRCQEVKEYNQNIEENNLVAYQEQKRVHFPLSSSEF
jgi:FkbM family methyltransferase